MRHHQHSVKFGRQRSHYKATLKSLVSALVISKSITTTKTKAKETSRLADKLITLGKEKTVTNQRRAYAIMGDRKLVAILFNEIAPLFKERKGGYTRVMLTAKRRGDNAQMAILEFVEKPKPPEPKKKADKKEKKPAAPVIETKAEKEEKPVQPEQKKEEHRKEERKKEAPQPKKPEKPVQRPGFFKKFFGRKGD
ncbi:MAG: 50S ribosomal protein L17 [Candidatus Omnitrophica bacterium CG_4_9_14_0_2_um_filter_42_8]|nr:MAG: 50S ribosomal protein L17 [Candidatus Omnitrophica bacterium CG22_combo_CG10-13_8_21_14_all_43_16]PJC48980.1 MAG: 50S ribosomal protein L17 [Candidatus Omnitrophica bacterium CG_4_9_14_0_2_um_filter_42_8]